MQIIRTFFINKIEIFWRLGSLIKIYGPCRIGKTSLLKQIPDSVYLDGNEPKEELLESIDTFLARGMKRFVFDNIHFLESIEPIEYLLDERARIAVTGTYSELLKFHSPRDTVGAVDLLLTPLIDSELDNINKAEMLTERLGRGGVPEMLLLQDAKRSLKQYGSKWLNLLWKNEIKPHYRVDQKKGFLGFVRLIIEQSGFCFEAKKLEAQAGLSHTTLHRYLQILRDTGCINALTPFHSGSNYEIQSAPKVYFFDTALVRSLNEWRTPDKQTLNSLFRHFLLNEIIAKLQLGNFNYWRDKRDHEMDFVFNRGEGNPIAVKCAWDRGSIDASSLKAFHRRYENADILCVFGDPGARKRGPKRGLINKIPVKYVNVSDLAEYLIRYY